MLMGGLYWQAEAELAEPKTNAKMIIRRLNRNSEPQASIEAGKYTLQYDML
jgi:vesicle transport protein SEC22